MMIEIDEIKDAINNLRKLLDIKNNSKEYLNGYRDALIKLEAEIENLNDPEERIP